MILKLISMGQNVKDLQKKLYDIGYELKIDGYFGTITETIIKSFQTAFSLKVDGIVGPATMGKINYIYKNKDSRSISTKHFKQSEFKCKCCGENPGIYLNLLLNLELVRYKLGGKAVSIWSGYRCKTHNYAVGSNENSQHRKCKAADINISGVKVSTLYKICDIIFKNDGVGRYDNFVHVDVRGWHARW